MRCWPEALASLLDGTQSVPYNSAALVALRTQTRNFSFIAECLKCQAGTLTQSIRGTAEQARGCRREQAPGTHSRPQEGHVEELSTNYTGISNSTRRPQTSGPLHISLPPDADQTSRAAETSTSAYAAETLSPALTASARSGLEPPAASPSARRVTWGLKRTL